MLYLAQIQRKRLSSEIQLTLLAVQRGSKLCAKVNPIETVNTTFTTQLKDDTLAIADLNSSRQVLKLTDAASYLPDLLHSYSLRLIKFSEQQREVELWRRSLELQSRELSDRANKLAALSEDLTEQEIGITEAVAHTKEWEAKIDTARQQLQSEWEKLRAEQRNNAEQ